MDKNITTQELANVLGVSTSIVEMFSKSLFNEVPANGFNQAQVEAIRNQLYYPFGKSDKYVEKMIVEDTADKWIQKVLGA